MVEAAEHPSTWEVSPAPLDWLGAEIWSHSAQHPPGPSRHAASFWSCEGGFITWRARFRRPLLSLGLQALVGVPHVVAGACAANERRRLPDRLAYPLQVFVVLVANLGPDSQDLLILLILPTLRQLSTRLLGLLSQVGKLKDQSLLRQMPPEAIMEGDDRNTHLATSVR